MKVFIQAALLNGIERWTRVFHFVMHTNPTTSLLAVKILMLDEINRQGSDPRMLEKYPDIASIGKLTHGFLDDGRLLDDNENLEDIITEYASNPQASIMTEAFCMGIRLTSRERHDAYICLTNKHPILQAEKKRAASESSTSSDEELQTHGEKKAGPASPSSFFSQDPSRTEEKDRSPSITK